MSAWIESVCPSETDGRVSYRVGLESSTSDVLASLNIEYPRGDVNTSSCLQESRVLGKVRHVHSKHLLQTWVDESHLWKVESRDKLKLA